MKSNFFLVNPAWLSVFQANNLDTFSALWALDIQLVDEPNRARGGWSEVGTFSLPMGGGEQQFYLKRQENFNCRSLSHPWRGVPVALREWLTIRNLSNRGVHTLDVAACGRQSRRDDRAVLVTESLDHYCDMDQWLEEHQGADVRRPGLTALGREIGRLHAAGMKHGCLYPKHVYFSAQDANTLRFIDLEKCKRIFTRESGLRDLDTLVRHTSGLTADERQWIYAGYIETCPHRWTASALEQAVAARVASKRVPGHD